jgi:hypothetical protein
MRMSRQNHVLFRIHFTDTSWENVEELDYKKRFESNIHTKMPDAERRDYHEKVETLLDMDPGRREEMKKAEVPNALEFLSKDHKQWSGYLDIVNKAGPYYQPPVTKMRDEDREAVAAHLKLFEMEDKCLRAGKEWKPADEAALREQRQTVKDFRTRVETPNETDDANPKPRSDAEVKAFNKDYMPKMNRAKKDVAEVWDDANQQRLKEVKDRHQVLVEKTLERTKGERQKLAELVAELDGAGPFKDKDVEEARLTGRDYLREWATLFELAEQCLRAGDGWTAGDTKKLETQLEKANKAKKDWLDLLQAS